MGVEMMRAVEGKAAYKDCSCGLDQRRKITQRGFYDGFDKTVQEKPTKKFATSYMTEVRGSLTAPTWKEEWVCTCAHVYGAKRRMTRGFAGVRPQQ